MISTDCRGTLMLLQDVSVDCTKSNFVLSSFWTLSIVQYILRHNVSDTGSVYIFRCGAGGATTVLGPLE
jgi:hypothetical protein